MRSRRSFHREFKLGVCREVEAGLKTKAQVCREHDLAPSLLDRWFEQFSRRGEEAFPNGREFDVPPEAARTRELEALVGRQALEIEFLKAALKKGAELREKKRL